MNRIELIKDRVRIEDVLALYGVTPNYKGKCRCPIHNDDTPSFQIYDNHFYCFGCRAYGDVIELYKKIEHISNKEAINRLMQIFHLDIYASAYDKPIEHKKIEYKTQIIENFLNPQVVEYLKDCERHTKETNYFAIRGINESTIKRFKLGYDPIKKEITIPYNKALTYYQSRSVTGKAFYKIPTKVAGSEPIFNEKAFDYTPIIFIVESPICAISIAQCGGIAVPLCGVANVRKLLLHLKQKFYTGTLVLCLDNDEAGDKATIDLIEGMADKNLLGLRQLNVSYIVENIADECKDPNELLVKDSIRLASNIRRVLQKIKGIAK